MKIFFFHTNDHARDWDRAIAREVERQVDQPFSGLINLARWYRCMSKLIQARWIRTSRGFPYEGD